MRTNDRCRTWRETSAADEAALVAALRAGDESAFRRVVLEQNAAMLRVAEHYVSSRAVAEEVVQETWLAVVKGVGRFEGRSSMKTWIFRILANIARSRGVREQRVLPVSSLGSDRVRHGLARSARSAEQDRSRSGDLVFDAHWVPAPKAQCELPEEQLASRETTRAIEAAIAMLPANQQRVVWLRDVESWTTDEVCEAFQLSEANQRVLLHRARTRVRTALQHHHFTVCNG